MGFRSAALTACLLATSCSSYKRDLVAMCDNLSQMPPDVHPEDQATVMMGSLGYGRKTAKATELAESFARLTPGETSKQLRAAAANEGIERCELADWIDSHYEPSSWGKRK